MFSTILIFIIVLSLLVFVHELGHFLTAKKMGMKVEEFGFGFPPRAIGWRKDKDSTIYSLNWLPLGGFVRVKGESGEHKNDPDSFSAQKPWRRFCVLIAGVVMNIILAAVLFSIGFMVGLPSVVDENVSKSASIEDQSIHILQVVEGSPAAEAGIAPGDELVSIEGRVFTDATEAREFIAKEGVDGVTLTLEKDDGSKFDAEVSIANLEGYDQKGIGVGLASTGIVSLPVHLAIMQGIETTWVMTGEIVKAFGYLIRDLVVKQEVSVDLSGPVGIAVLTGEVAERGLIHLLQFTAILSINLAIINVLPFPALDGGRILFLFIEKIRRKPVDEKVEAVIHNIGFALLMLLVILVTYKDLTRYGGQIWGAIKGLIGA